MSGDLFRQVAANMAIAGMPVDPKADPAANYGSIGATIAP